ncbi:hypothetical protein [Streptomyces sp. Isolate_45]|uniref:hypothetical protein n=1 Tax=Streptomyces sp. Isolate_45 TaxID=2950111 RepID=UPI0024819AC2|nr:hypothetical protein [Streptomyces sp. Isolate_45]MDA5279616.1 hypothetical protein [Streptomyces sp. Isolate_45]
MIGEPVGWPTGFAHAAGPTGFVREFRFWLAFLAEPYRTPATEWARAWAAERVADHTAGGRN